MFLPDPLNLVRALVTRKSHPCKQKHSFECLIADKKIYGELLFKTLTDY